MADWGSSGFNEMTTAGAVVGTTPSNTAHVKGAWATAFTNPQPSMGFSVNTTWSQAHSTARTLFFDIAVDGVVIVENIALNPSGSGAGAIRAHSSRMFFPVVLPAGVVQVRCQSSMGTHGIVYFIIEANTSRSPDPLHSVVHTLGAKTATTRGTVVAAHNTTNTWGSWTEIAANSPRLRSIATWVGHGNSWLTGYTACQWYQIQIGIGPVGEEVKLWHPLEIGNAIHATGLASPQWSCATALVDIHEGSRISVRANAEFTGSTQRNRDIILYGFA